MIHAWAKRQGMDDELYRDWLRANFGATSCKNMNAGQFGQFLAMAGLAPPMPGQKKHPDRLTDTQNRMILALWGQKSRKGDLQSLSAWLKGRWGVASSKQLTKSQASRVITALQKEGW